MELMTICGKKMKAITMKKELSMLVNIKRKPLKWVESVMKFTINTNYLKKRNIFFFFRNIYTGHNEKLIIKRRNT